MSEIDAVAAIRRLYYAATKASIERDMARAIALLKTLPSEEARMRAAVYMDGLAQLRSEWSQGQPRRGQANTGSTTGRENRRKAPG